MCLAPRTAGYPDHVSKMLNYALIVTAGIMGGPTFFRVEQDFVSAVTIGETYPFDTATFASAATKPVSKGGAVNPRLYLAGDGGVPTRSEPQSQSSTFRFGTRRT